MRPRRLRVFAVEDTAVQVDWSCIGVGEVQADVVQPDHSVHRRLHFWVDGGAGTMTVAGLEPSAETLVHMRGAALPAEGVVLRTRTLTPPPGHELFRFATVSDTHLGATSFGVRGRIRDPVRDVMQAHPFRCTTAAVAEAVAWGARMLVHKGDLTHRAYAAEWEAARKVLGSLPVPVLAVPGNHDVRRRDWSIPAPLGSARWGVDMAVGEPRAVDLPGIRIVLVDTNDPGHHRGHIDRALAELTLDLVDDSDRPVFVVLHHHLERAPFTWFWPPGIPRSEAVFFLDGLAARARHGAFVTSGHTHRHRSSTWKGVAVCEVGSPKDYPGTWAGYVVHEGGIRQVVKRVSDTRCVHWTETTRRAACGAWGLWSPGLLRHRCFTHRWR
ncbi:MAG: hypothetical protein KatS3mg008_1869 [Acidimicrobiales bacterium]|nr:MAG: hypothetical protein KatS3mg008_1869 [Acidimicrobiales bacterium]